MKIIDPSNKIWNVHVWILWILRYLFFFTILVRFPSINSVFIRASKSRTETYDALLSAAKTNFFFHILSYPLTHTVHAR